MYQTSDTKMRRKGEPSARRLRRRAALLLSAVSLAVILLGSAAYALNIECQSSIGGDPCIGTDGVDVMRGTDGDDSIVGLGGDDVIHGLGGFDRLTGDGNAATAPGNDQLLAVLAPTALWAAPPPTGSTARAGATRSRPISSLATAPTPSREVQETTSSTR